MVDPDAGQAFDSMSPPREPDLGWVDPDTPTADASATCNSGTGGGETCALPRGHSGPHDPDAPYLGFSPANMARLREKALQNYIDTADAPADTDLRERLERCHFCGHRSRAHYDDGCIECDECDVPFPDCVLPLVRAQVEAARRDALNEAADDIEGRYLGAAKFLRDRAARGETRQP